ncbi:MAG: fatty acid desaturase [Alphaproteobacteria bacterium]|nr:fatty acid desaturase [Alphaproteobacteria bacterium]
MDEVFARRDLIEPAVLRALCTRSDRAGLLQLGSHLAAVGVTGAGIAATLGTLWVVPVFVLHGVLINFLYAAQHETSHYTAFRSRWLNEAVGRAIGFFLLYPRDFDQIQHYAHHRHTQDWARDGELERPPFGRASYLLWLLGATYWTSRAGRIVRFAGGRVSEHYIPPARHGLVIREARWHVAGYALIAAGSVAAGSTAALLYWLAPMLLTKAAHQLQNTIEHLGMPHVGDVLRNTRSTRTGRAMRWLCWNMQYHTAHHAFPGVPFHRLPQLHARLFTDRGTAPPSMGYFAFQRAVLRALARGRSEADYPRDRAWIAESGARSESSARP